MSFARPRVFLGIRPVLNSQRTTPAVQAVILRQLSTSRTSCAQHQDELQSNLQTRHTRHAAPSGAVFDGQGNEINPYKGGPSSIDKAVHLFFFTEIIRGMHTCSFSYWLFWQGPDLPKGCGLCLRTSSDLHTPLCTHSRRVHCLHDSAVNMLCGGTQAVKNVA
jgi:hypothetical protein